MGQRPRLSTRGRTTEREEETVRTGKSAATHRCRRCTGLSERPAVSLDKAWRRRTGRLRAHVGHDVSGEARSEEHTSELQSLMRISYAVFCLNKKKHKTRMSGD